MSEQDDQNMTARAIQRELKKLGQNVRAGQLGKTSLDIIAGTGQPGQRSRDIIAGTEEP